LQSPSSRTNIFSIALVSTQFHLHRLDKNSPPKFRNRASSVQLKARRYPTMPRPVLPLSQAQTELPYKVSKAIEEVKRILDETRNPQFFANVEDHQYDDKFALADYVVNVGLATLLNNLEVGLGLDSTKLSLLMELSSNASRAITLRFVVHETCTFLCDKLVDLSCGTSVVTNVEKEGILHKKTNTTIKSYATDYHWKMHGKYVFMAFVGSNPTDEKFSVVLQDGEFGGQVVQRGRKIAPGRNEYTTAPLDVNLTHLLHLIHGNACRFAINRERPTCRTPLNNDEMKSVQEKIILSLQGWSTQVRGYFQDYASSLPETTSGVDSPWKKLEDDVENANQQIFIPVLPFFDDSEGTNGSKDESNFSGTLQGEQQESGIVHLPSNSSYFQNPRIFSVQDTASLLGRHHDALVQTKSSMLQKAGSSEAQIDTLGGKVTFLCVTAKQFETATEYMQAAVFSIEGGLRDKLLDAVGKHVTANDFAEYMKFHNQCLLKPQYTPAPFCFSVRRPNHAPEGTLSILSQTSEKSDIPSDRIYHTLRRKIDTCEVDGVIPTITLPVNAATHVQVMGDRYVHAILAHQFDSSSKKLGIHHNDDSSFQLVARARQFSSFMLVLGTITGPHVFDPTDAIILTNKDELYIPLLLEQMPSPKHFREAIQSLSPEQQRFAKAYRRQQLSSSVFGIMIIQLKPQLEILLNLPEDSLTKEVKLTQSLLELFIEYQIPSDLLTYDQGDDLSTVSKINAVKEYVKGVEDMIAESKKKTITDEESKAEMRHFIRHQEEQDSSSFRSGQGMSGTKMMRKVGTNMAHRRLVKYARSDNDGFMVDPQSMELCAAPLFKSELPDAAPTTTPPVAESPFSSHEGAPLDQQAASQDLAQPFSDVPPSNEGTSTAFDLSLLTKKLDETFQHLDKDAALCPTKVKAEKAWKKTYYKNILAKQETKAIDLHEQRQERNKAFDLLDAISRSGSLPIRFAELHAIVAATHCFDQSLINTVIHDNVDPIEKFERSVLIVASVIHGLPANAIRHLISTPEEARRVESLSPNLLTNVPRPDGENES